MFFLQRMLRDPEDAPSSLFQLPIHLTVALTVASDFGFPKLPVSIRCPIALGAAVPETPVDKDCQPLLPEREIRLSRKFQMASPPDDSLIAKELHQHTFCPLVTLPPDPRHHFGSLGLGEDVGHIKIINYQVDFNT